MTVTGRGWVESLAAVRSARPCASPNLGFLRQLEEFENTELPEVSERCQNPPAPEASGSEPQSICVKLNSALKVISCARGEAWVKKSLQYVGKYYLIFDQIEEMILFIRISEEIIFLSKLWEKDSHQSCNLKSGLNQLPHTTQRLRVNIRRLLQLWLYADLVRWPLCSSADLCAPGNSLSSAGGAKTPPLFSRHHFQDGGDHFHLMSAAGQRVDAPSDSRVMIQSSWDRTSYHWETIMWPRTGPFSFQICLWLWYNRQLQNWNPFLAFSCHLFISFAGFHLVPLPPSPLPLVFLPLIFL